jgi:hypothetical protein
MHSSSRAALRINLLDASFEGRERVASYLTEELAWQLKVFGSTPQSRRSAACEPGGFCAIFT